MSDAPSMRFGQRLKEARQQAGLSQEDVARLSGLAQQHVSQIERGLLNLTLDTMTKLAEAVGQSLSDLLREE